MKLKSIVCLIIILLFTTYKSYAQVSHGGTPLPLHKTKSSINNLFVEMPSFDLKEELKLDSLNQTDLRGGYKFAYKFVTELNQYNSGYTFFLPDGTRVWRLGLRSKGALSINIFFSEYNLPEGAKVFVYNSNQTQILGSFTDQNNSELNVLPIAPIYGEELIIEYHEPSLVSFQGKLTVGEVNHAYKDLRGSEPLGDRADLQCIPPLVCFDQEKKYKEIERSVIVMIIDGTTACSGVMVNNTSNDGTPYVLTASHCLNKQFFLENPNYARVASSIVFFFNYNSPVCNSIMRGTEELSMASSIFEAINEDNDLAILKLLETPPPHYQPYYAGWNINEKPKPPFSAIHHPGGSVKRISMSKGSLGLKSFAIPQQKFTPNSHWYIDQWDIGCTAGGSSGSPLFDSENRIVGLLSGGGSNCDDTKSDYYLALHKAWNPNVDEKKQLKYWLNPSSTKSITSCNGLDPYKINPAIRLSNIREAGAMDKIGVSNYPTDSTGRFFGSNSMLTNEYAEEYYINGTATIFGTYLVTPSIVDNPEELSVTVSVYSGTDKPEILLCSEKFAPKYLNKIIFENSFLETDKHLNRNQESFIKFEKPLNVTGRIFIAYKINSPQNSSFCVFNTIEDAAPNNTAWINLGNEWIQSSKHPLFPIKTSLYIDPVVQYEINSSIKELEYKNAVLIVPNRSLKHLNVKLPDQIHKAIITIYSLSGQVVLKKTINENNSQISVFSLNSGAYLVQVNYENKSYTQKVIL